jgi:hypothetical protein
MGAALDAVRHELHHELPPPRALAALDEAAARGAPAWWPYGEEAGVVQFGYGAYSVRLHVSELEAGVPVPWERARRVPIVAITGTNGKTTTTRLLARIARSAGLPAGNTSSDGVVIGDMWVLGGDYTGAAGAARVLSDPYVQVAVLETARGGMLRTGLGFDYPDVALLTNVTPDHLGQFGVESVDEMAQVKGLLLELLPPQGRAVLNARDPRLVAQAAQPRAGHLSRCERARGAAGAPRGRRRGRLPARRRAVVRARRGGGARDRRGRDPHRLRRRGDAQRRERAGGDRRSASHGLATRGDLRRAARFLADARGEPYLDWSSAAWKRTSHNPTKC